jgi:hypothetical protein
VIKRLLVYGLLFALAPLVAGLGCGTGPALQSPGAGGQGNDPAATCGNGRVDTAQGETCDTGITSGEGACPTSCPGSGDACNPRVLVHAGTCTAACGPQPVTVCQGGDGCCAPGCTAANDRDCASCGNGMVDTSLGETCDTAIQSGAGACPTTCPSSGDACSPSVLAHAGTCTAACAPQPITACHGGDGCCPAGCTAATDSDCSQQQLVDVTGTWFTYTSAKGTLRTTPPSGAIAAPITDTDVTVNTWVRSYTAPSGEIRFNICKLEVIGTKIKTTYSEKVIATFQTTARATGPLQVPVGSPDPLPTYAIYSGQDAAGQAVDTVPPPFPGGDGDGHPGVTVPTQVKVLVWTSFNAYSGMTITTTTSEVKVASATTKTGKTSVTTHGVTFGSDNTLLSPAGTTFDLTFNDGSVPFTSTKVASDDSATYSCAYLVQHYPQ